MSVTYNPFVSKSGFKSNGFDVDASGNLTTQTIVSQSLNAVILNASEIKVNGSSILGSEDSTFQIETDFIISEGSVPYVSVINGQVTIRNKSNTVGKIDNVDIGTIIPAAGIFTSVNTPLILDNDTIEVYIGSAKVGEINGLGITIPLVNTSINNTVIGNTTPRSGAFTALSATQAITFNTTTNNQSYTTTGAGAITITSGTTGAINNMSIGATTASTGTFTALSATTLTATQAITFNTTTNNQSYTTTGAGAITITSGTTGAINNMSIGAITASTGTFTALSATQTVGFNTTTNNQSYITSGAGTITITSGTTGAINNMSIGAITASTGRFTSVTVATEPTSDTELANKLYVDKKVRLAIAMSGI